MNFSSLKCWYLAFFTIILSALNARAVSFTWANYAGSAGGAGYVDGTGSNAHFTGPTGVAVDGSGNVYVADTGNNTIRAITPAGVVTTLAGTPGVTGSADGTGSAARFNGPRGVAVDGGGNVYVADTQNNTIRKIAPGGVVTTLAGIPNRYGGFNDGPASTAQFDYPYGVAVDGSSNVYVADFYNYCVRKITPGGTVSTLANLPSTPNGVACDGSGNVYVAGGSGYYSSAVAIISPAGTITSLSGPYSNPSSVAVDGSGNVYVTDASYVQEIAPGGEVTLRASGINSAGVAVDGSGNLYVGDTGNNVIREINPADVVTTFAGSINSSGYGTGPGAPLNTPTGLVLDGSGNAYFVDSTSETIREISASGSISTVAGWPYSSGTADGQGFAARFRFVNYSNYNYTGLTNGLAEDSSGNLYVADEGNNTIRKIAPGGTVSTLAGRPGVSGTTDGTGSAALFSSPAGLGIDAAGDIYVADSGNNTIRKITQAGQVTTIAGRPGYSAWADGLACNAYFRDPTGIAVDAAGHVFVVDTFNYCIREIFSDAAVVTIAGAVSYPYGVIDGIGTVARFSAPSGIAVDGSGNVYVSDQATVRMINPSYVVTTVGGAPSHFGNQPGPGSAALFSLPSGIVASGSGALYVADASNNEISIGTPFISSSSPAPVLISPFAGQQMIPEPYIQFTLPTAALPGSVHLIFNDGITLRTLTLSSYAESSGSHSFYFSPGSPLDNSQGCVSAISGDTEIPFGTYTVTLSYQDVSGDPAATASAANVTLQPLATSYANSINSFSGYVYGGMDIAFNSSTDVSNAHFDWGATASYGNSATASASYWWNWNGGYPYSAFLSGLDRDTTYHYRFVATLDGTTYYGADQTFKTAHDDPPRAQSYTFYSGTKPSSLVLNVLANDYLGNPGNTITITVSQPSRGKAVVSGSNILYTANSRYDGYDSFTYTLSDGYGGTSTANIIVTNPNPPFAGTYQSLAGNNGMGGTPGYITVTLGAQGAFTGSYKTLGTTYAFKGTLDSNGNCNLTIARAKPLPALSLSISLDYSDQYGMQFSMGDIAGDSSNGYFTQKITFSTVNPCPQAGTYTVLLPPPPDAPGYMETGSAQASVAKGKVTSIGLSDPGAGYYTTPTVTITDPLGKSAAARAWISNGSISNITVSGSGTAYTGTGTVVTIAPPSGLPVGTGWATVTVTAAGAITVSGKLGDGVAFTAGSWIDTSASFNGGPSGGPGSYSFPLYANVYSAPAGSISGYMLFEDTGYSDFDGQLGWYKPQQTIAQLFDGGFSDMVDMIGSVYVNPTTDYLIDMPAMTTPGGNALLTLTAGNLLVTGTNALSIGPTPASAVTILTGTGTDGLSSVTCAAANGSFSGKFTAPGTKTAIPFSGVFFQYQELGSGVFQGATQSGNVNLTPPPAAPTPTPTPVPAIRR